MSNKHTPEPWSLSDAKNAAGVILGGPSRSLHTGTAVQSQIASACLQEWMTHGERDANARRIVACVNACRGLPTDELEQKGLVAAVGTELLALDTKLAAVTNTRDQLLGVMDSIADVLEELSLEDSQSRLKGGAAGIASGIRKSIVAIVSSSLC